MSHETYREPVRFTPHALLWFADINYGHFGHNNEGSGDIFLRIAEMSVSDGQIGVNIANIGAFIEVLAINPPFEWGKAAVYSEKNSYRSLLEDERPRLAEVFIANKNLFFQTAGNL